MSTDLHQTVAALRDTWGAVTTERIQHWSTHVASLAHGVRAASGALGEVDAPATQEWYRDPQHGFILWTHRTPAGVYREPHDHGLGWVIYAVVDGEVEMSTWARVADPDGTRLVRRVPYRMGPGDVQVFLPGDIHDTRTLAQPAHLLRLTSRDTGVELREGRMTVYDEAPPARQMPG